MTENRPKALRRGDLVGVVAPSGPPSRARLEHALARLQQRGLRVRTYADLNRSRGYLAGTDAQRATELQAALADPETRAILPVRGGYGLTRTLRQVDFAKAAREPKIVVGYSDVTAMHLAIHRHLGWVTFHGPNLEDGMGAEHGMTAETSDAYQRALFADAQSSSQHVLQAPSDAPPTLRWLNPGAATGRLVGGNLTLLGSTIGTEFEIDTRDAILFLEDVDEQPYRIDRYLSQLALAGKLRQLRGVVLGHFTRCEPKSEKGSLSLDEVFGDYFSGLGVPVVAGFPAGHDKPNLTLPLGHEVRLSAADGGLVIERPAVVVVSG